MAIPTTYDVAHACGHDQTHDLSDKKAGDRAGFAKWLARKDCLECWKAANPRDTSGRDAERDQVAALAAEAAEKMQLPALIGSDKQVTWADRIRYQLMSDAYEIHVVTGDLDDADYDAQVVDPARMLDRARWWIDNREVDPSDLPELLADPGALTAGATTENAA